MFCTCQGQRAAEAPCLTSGSVSLHSFEVAATGLTAGDGAAGVQDTAVIDDQQLVGLERVFQVGRRAVRGGLEGRDGSLEIGAVAARPATRAAQHPAALEADLEPTGVVNAGRKDRAL